MTREISLINAIDELEGAIRGGSSGRRLELLRELTDLFLHDSHRLSEDQTAIFDDLLCRLIQHVEKRALVALSARLGPVEKAPIKVIGVLARDPEIAIAEPVLSRSLRLTSDDLAEIARMGSQAHLLAISGRGDLSEDVTDVLLAKGNRDVLHKVASNSRSRISQAGFEKLVDAAADDEALAEAAALRGDIPLEFLRQLLVQATTVVRQTLLGRLPDDIQAHVRDVLDQVSDSIDQEVTKPLNFEVARRFVDLLHRDGELSETTLADFIRTGRYEETVAALAALSSSSIPVIRPLMHRHRRQGLLVPCRVANLKWETVSLLMQSEMSLASMSATELKQARQDFEKLSMASAQRLLRFWQTRAMAAHGADGIPNSLVLNI